MTNTTTRTPWTVHHSSVCVGPYDLVAIRNGHAYFNLRGAPGVTYWLRTKLIRSGNGVFARLGVIESGHG